LVLLLLIPTLIACNNQGEGPDLESTSTPIQNNESQSTSASETNSEAVTEKTESSIEEKVSSVEEKNYDTEFFLSIHPDSNPVKYYWVEENDSDVMSSAIFNRQELVQRHLGVEVIATTTPSMTEYVDQFKNAVKIKDGSVDALISHVYFGIDGFITENYLQDFKEVESIDLSADHWNESFMEDVTINDRMYLGFSDFNIMYTHVIAFNKTLMDKYDDELKESVYEMVENYHWTLDQMISLANLVYIDETSDGKTMDDTFGITGLQEIAFCGFLQSSNINLFNQDDSGQYTLSVMNEVNKNKTSHIIDVLKNLAKSNCAWALATDDSSLSIAFEKEKVLMTLARTYSLPNYANFDFKFGVLPYPMYDENQKDVGYRSLQWGGFICIPSYVNNINMVGDTLEVISFYSEDVNTAYYEKLLGKQVSESPLDTKMLQIIWDGICTDFGQTFYQIFYDSEILYLVPRIIVENSTRELGSYVAGAEKAINKALKKFYTKVSKE